MEHPTHHNNIIQENNNFYIFQRKRKKICIANLNPFSRRHLSISPLLHQQAQKKARKLKIHVISLVHVSLAYRQTRSKEDRRRIRKGTREGEYNFFILVFHFSISFPFFSILKLTRLRGYKIEKKRRFLHSTHNGH